jgi:hypothetical protein
MNFIIEVGHALLTIGVWEGMKYLHRRFTHDGSVKP